MEKADRPEFVGSKRFRVIGGPTGSTEAARSRAEVRATLRRPRLELRQLYAFVAVAEELHFGRAAARIHVAQSPLSRIIRNVEVAAGVTLFVRNKRHVSLTPAGVVLLEGARELLRLAEIVEVRMA